MKTTVFEPITIRSKKVIKQNTLEDIEYQDPNLSQHLDTSDSVSKGLEPKGRFGKSFLTLPARVRCHQVGSGGPFTLRNFRRVGADVHKE